MYVRRRGFLAIAVCIVAVLLIALSSVPGPLQAQSPAAAGPPGSRGSKAADLAPSPALRGRVGEGALCPTTASSTTASNAPATFGRTFQVSNADTWADSVFPTADGYLVLGDHDIPGSFATNLTRFNSGGRPVRSFDVSISPSWPKSGRVSADGGFLLAICQAMEPRTKDEGRLLKLGPDLSVQWAKGISSDGPVNASGLVDTLDGGTITLLRDNRRLGILKLNASGGVEWKKSIRTAANVESVTVYSIVENAYLDGAGQKQCGGYVLYGGVDRPGSGWDIYLAALSCDGSSLFWQRIVSGPAWEASSWDGGLFYDYTTNLIVVTDRNGLSSQDADLLLAASTGSYGTGDSVMLVPLTIKGGTTLSTPPDIGPIRILDGLDDELVIGPYGGPNLIRLAEGNLLLGGLTRDGAGLERALLVKLEPDLDLLWQHAYEYGAVSGLAEESQQILVAGGGPPGILLRLAPDGSDQGPCLTRNTPQLTLRTVSPDIVDPVYTLQDGAFQVADVTVTLTEVAVDHLCPGFQFLPTVRRKVQ